MIQHLQIQGLAIIDSLSIDFSSGFNVITGETGAGKSILIRALSFLLGQKASSDVVRKGYDQAVVAGEFILPANHEGLEFLRSHGVPFEWVDSGAEILVRRQVNAKGRSSAWINDFAVTGQTLKELGLHLVDIFGQHDNQKLMRPEFHLSYVDKFLAEPKLVQEFKAIYKTCYDLIKEISRNLEGFNSRSKDSDYRLFRLDELDKFNPSVADFDKVTQQAESSASALELKEGLSQLLSALENEESSVNSVLWGVAKGLSRLEEKASGPALTELHGRAETLARGIDELNYEISRLLSSVDVDEESIEEAQKRVFDYQELFRKHGVKDIGALLSEYERLKTECLSQEEATIKFKADLDKAFQLSKQVRSAAETLSKHRMKAGERIKKTVEKELSELAMAGAKFDICWEDCDGLKAGLDFASFKSSQLDSLSRSIDETWTGMGTEGFERAEFMLASNPGEPVLPLLKVASGGELSRIMLALKKALVADADTCVLVFDEIDTGISGRIADVVGKKMYELSRDFQVLCISHLPQVAVYADTHFLVKKEAKGVRTESRIIPLTSEESASEIARLLSGSEVSKSSLANAKNLIQKAKSHETKQRRGLNY